MGGIYYDLNTSAKTATVTSNPDKYSGHVFLPESINYDGITYTVTRIGTCAFLDCSSLEGITIPSGVTVIEPSAFERCSGLTALTVGKGVTTIDYEAFKNCIRLATLILPASLNTIGNESFGGCTSLRTIVVERTTAPKIVSTTFNGVDKAACTLYVPEGCRSAYANAAYWKLFTNIVDNRTDVLATGQCGDNVTYTIYSDMKMVISGEGEMWHNDGYENPICGDYSQSIQQLIVEEGVTTISHYAFFGYNRLTSVDIPPSITVLGNSAFRGCSSLERINIHNLTAWCGIEFGNTHMDYYPDAPFDNMPLYLNGELIEELVIPEEITDISAGAFYRCRSLTSVYIFADVEVIRRYTFDGCDNVTFLYIGNGLGYFGWFSINMPNLRTFVLNAPEPPAIDYMSIFIGNATIYVPSGSLATYGRASGWENFPIVDKPIVLETGACGDNVSYTLYSDMKMVISGTGEMWDIYDSENPICEKYAQFVQQVIIEEGVTTISGYSFYGYNRLTTVDVPPSITVIGSVAFGICSSLERINICDLSAWCKIEMSSAFYPHLPLYLNGEEIQVLVIPEDVTSINESAFVGCNGLTSLIVSHRISIYPYAFDECSNLDFVKMDDGTLMGSSLGNNLKTIVLTASTPPSIVGWAAFLGNPVVWVPYGSASNYKNSTNPYGEGPTWRTKDIHEYYRSSEGIFYGLEPENLTAKVITTDYFDYTDPMEVTIPATIECEGVTYTLTGVSHKAFEINRSVTKIVLPSTIMSVEDFAFSKCTALTDLYCRAVEPPAASAFAFGNLNVSEVVLRVPAGSKEAYQSAEGWKDFANIVDEIIVVETGSCGENTEYTIYSDGTMKIAGTGAINEFYPETVSSNFIQELTIEEGVTLIGESAFSGVRLSYGWQLINEWRSLATVHVPNSVTSIGQLAFLETPWYNSQPDGVVYAGKVVCGVKGIDGQDVILQEGTLGISPSAFWGVHIASLHIPASVESINPSVSSYEDAFVESLSYDNIDFITINPENPHFDSRDNCNAIIETATNRLIVGSRNMQIPEGVTTIGPFALSGQTSVTIPASVTRIEEFAFTNSYGYWIPGPLVGYIYFSEPSPVETIEMKGSNPPEIKSPGKVGYENGGDDYVSDYYSTFCGVDIQVCTLRVPAGSKEAYQSSDGWKDFANIVEDVSDNAIYVERVEGRIGGTMDIPVKLRNSYAVRGFQFVMELPEGTTINSWALSADRLPSGATQSDVLATQKIEGNKIIVACSLNYGDATFTGNDGEIATINVTFGEEMEAGTYPIYLTECDVTNAVGTDEALSDVTGTLILEDYVIGDANSDGKVRVGDAIAILSYIIGNTPDNFNEKAADVNGDGLLRIGDVTAVLNIIVNQ